MKTWDSFSWAGPHSSGEYVFVPVGKLRGVKYGALLTGEDEYVVAQSEEEEYSRMKRGGLVLTPRLEWSRVHAARGANDLEDIVTCREPLGQTLESDWLRDCLTSTLDSYAFKTLREPWDSRAEAVLEALRPEPRRLSGAVVEREEVLVGWNDQEYTFTLTAGGEAGWPAVIRDFKGEMVEDRAWRRRVLSAYRASMK